MAKRYVPSQEFMSLFCSGGKKVKPPPENHYCSKCGHGTPTYRYELNKATHERCPRCGGNLVMRRELPVGVVPVG